MKGKKLVFAVILSLIVCLLLVPTCAFAETEITENPEIKSEEIETPKTPVEGETPKTPAEGETPKTPVEGETPKTPAEGETPKTPAEGETPKTPAEGETPKTPAEGETPKTPAEGETPKTPVEGETPKTPAEGETPKPPVEGEETPKTPSEGGENPAAPAAGGENNGSFMVEFSYGDKSYKLEDLKGNEQFGLADILKQLGIEGSIDNAKGDADDLFAAENGEEGWKVTTKKAFTSEQTMTVVVDGVEYVLKVIDDRGVKSDDDLNSFINDENTDKKFYLENDIVGNIVIPEGKTITIDLMGHTLTCTSGYAITNNGNLTIIDTVGNGIVARTEKCDGACGALLNNGEAHLVAGTYSSFDGTIITNYGKVTAEKDVTVKFRDGTPGRLLVSNGWEGDKNQPTNGRIASFIINGGTYGHETNNEYGLYNLINGYLEINNAAVIKSRKASIRNNWLHSKTVNTGNKLGEIVINNANITAGYEGAVCSWNGGTATINGGTFTGNTASAIIGNSSSTITIKGGTFTNAIGPAFWSSKDAAISGGTFTSAPGKPTLNISGGSTKLTGGVFSSNDVSTANNQTGSLLDFVGDDDIVVKSGSKYAVNESGYQLAKKGETVEVVKAPAGAKIDIVPGGVTVKNNTDNTIYVNGVAVEPYKETVEAPVVEAPAVKQYEVVEGDKQTWTKSAAELLTFAVNAEAEHVKSYLVKIVIKVDNVEHVIDAADYSVDENGKIVLTAEALEKLGLEEGEYEIEFVFSDGRCKAVIIVKAD